MKTLLLSLSLVVGSTLMGQEIQSFTSKTIWAQPQIGSPIKSLEVSSGGVVVFLYRDQQYTYVDDYGSFSFSNLTEAETFFLKIKELFNQPYTKGDYVFFQTDQVRVSRVPSMLGIKVSRVSQGSKYTYLEEYIVNRIITNIQEIKNQQS
jgi:hypothetical protein